MDRIKTNAVSRVFERWARFVAHHPWPVLLITLAILGGFASQVPRIVLDTSTEGFLHRSDPTLVAYDAFREQFGRDDAIIIGVKSDDIFSFEFLERLRSLHEQLEKDTPFLDEITSMLNARRTRGEDDQLIVEDLVEHWPQGETGLAELRKHVYANPLYLDNLINREGNLTTILVEVDTFVQSGVDDRGKPILRYLNGEEHREIVESVRATIAEHNGVGFEIHPAGILWMADRLAFRMLEDLPAMMGRALILMAIILFALFGNLRSVLLPLSVILSSLLVALGLMPLLGMAYQVPTQVMPVSLLAIGIGDSIHVLAVYYVHRRKGETKEDAIAGAFAHSGPAILVTSLTTAAALASFLSAAIAPIANIGVLLPAGVLAAFVLTLTLLPALLCILPERGEAPVQRNFVRIESGLRTLGAWASNRPIHVLLIAAGVTFISILGVTRINFAHNPLFWFPKDNAFRQSTLYLNDALGGVVTLEVLFETSEPDGVKNPTLLTAIDDLARDNAQRAAEPVAAGSGLTGLRPAKTISIADLLKEVNRALNKNQDVAYRLPDSRDLAAQELLLFELSGNNDLEDLVDYEYKTARMTIRVPWVDATYYSAFIDGLAATYSERIGDMAQIEFTGRVPLLTRTMTAVLQSTALSYVIAFAAVTPMMMVLLGSPSLGLIAMIPNILPIIAALGLMGWMGYPLDVFSLLTGSIALGVAVDDTIHFMHGVRREMQNGCDAKLAIDRTLAVTGQALFSTTLILCAGFSLYATAYMQNTVNFGIVTAFALGVAFLADVILGPALVVLAAKRFAAKPN